MKKFSKLILVIIFTGFYASFCFSASQSHLSEVARIQTQSNGDWIIFFKDQDPDCTSTNTPWKKHHVYVGKNGVDEDGSTKMLSLALTAAVSGKKVVVYFDDSSSECYVNRLYVNF